MLRTASIPIDLFLEIEPQLKEFYGINRNDLFDIIQQSVDSNKLKEVSKPYSEIHKANDFMECAFKVLESIYIQYNDNQLDKFHVLCNKYEIDESSTQHSILLFLFLLSAQEERENLTVSEEAETEFWQYAVGVRPEMLRLYIALHNGKTKYRKPKNLYPKNPYPIKIAFGDSSPIEVDTMFPWLQMAIDEYLDKYLGVKDVKEAKRELNTIYYKKVGAKLDTKEATYMWGTYHLLQTIEGLKSSKPKSVTRKQSRFITEYLSILNILDSKHTEAESIRGRLTRFLKTYDSLDELIQNTRYKTSPNNKGGWRYF